MAIPKNKKLYEKVKKEIYEKIPKHSAYRSGLLVKTYKERGGKYEGKKTEGGLTRWFKEDWRTQDNKKTYQKKGDVFRPTKRVNQNTPTTFKELTPAQIKKAQVEKKKTGRVKKYNK